MLELWRNAVGTCPASFEIVEYVFVSTCCLVVITLIFRFIISLIKIIFGKE